MRAVMKTGDLVAVDYARAVLRGEGIACEVFDDQMCIMEGGIGAFPRRLMVADDDFARASALLREAVPGFVCSERE